MKQPIYMTHSQPCATCGRLLARGQPADFDGTYYWHWGEKPPHIDDGKNERQPIRERISIEHASLNRDL